MELAGPNADSLSDLFFDALDAFLPPEPQETLDSITTPHPESVGNRPQEEIPANLLPEAPPPASLHLRRSSKKSSTRGISDSNDPSCNSPRERRSKILLALKDQAVSEIPDASCSTLTSDQSSTGGDPGQESSIVEAPTTSSSHVAEPPAVNSSSGSYPPQSLLVSIASLVIKAIFFQINLLINCFTLPIWLLHCSFLLATDPFGTLKRARHGMQERLLWIWKALLERISPLVYERLGSQQGVGRFLMRLALGCFWSFYVGFVLFGLLAMSFFAGTLLMRWAVEKPIQITEDLHFDYTKPTPDALVPMISGGGVGCNFNWGGKAGVRKNSGGHLVPPNHRLQLTILLTLPESDYNKKLGVFQVRAEFLSANGKATSSLSQPCMLHFKSSHISFMETFLKSGTLLAGYSSESQILRIKMTGFTEGTEPTVCIRVILEQRAEYRPGAGIPEIYAASIKLESQLPLMNRIVWNWRRTVFIWVGMGLFILEILVVLVCCRPFIVPRARSTDSPSRL